MDIGCIVSAHGPVLRGPAIADAYERVRGLAARPAVPTPGQELLDEMLAAFAAGTPAVG